MAYGFNDDKSKFSLSGILSSISSLISSVTRIGDDIGDINGRLDQIDEKVSNSDFQIIEGTVTLPGESSSLENYTSEQVQDLFGIDSLEDYAVVSLMYKKDDTGSWLTMPGNYHTNLGYTSLYMVEMNDEKQYPLQIQFYNPFISAMDITYRIVLMKVVA